MNGKTISKHLSKLLNLKFKFWISLRNLSLSWPHRIVSWRCSQGKLTESIYLFDTEIWKARKYRKTSQIIHWELWWPFLENLEINLRPYKKVRPYFNSQAPELSRGPRARYARSGENGEGKVRSLWKLGQGFRRC